MRASRRYTLTLSFQSTFRLLSLRDSSFLSPSFTLQRVRYFVSLLFRSTSTSLFVEFQISIRFFSIRSKISFFAPVV